MVYHYMVSHNLDENSVDMLDAMEKYCQEKIIQSGSEDIDIFDEINVAKSQMLLADAEQRSMLIEALWQQVHTRFSTADDSTAFA